MVPSSPEGKLLLDLEVEQGLKCMFTKPTWIEMRGSLVTKSFSLTILNYLRTVRSMILCSVTTDLFYGFLNKMVKHQKSKTVTFRSLKNFDVEK